MRSEGAVVHFASRKSHCQLSVLAITFSSLSYSRWRVTADHGCTANAPLPLNPVPRPRPPSRRRRPSPSKVALPLRQPQLQLRPPYQHLASSSTLPSATLPPRLNKQRTSSPPLPLPPPLPPPPPPLLPSQPSSPPLPVPTPPTRNAPSSNNTRTLSPSLPRPLLRRLLLVEERLEMGKGEEGRETGRETSWTMERGRES
jgi:hypothetical protein